MMTRSQLQKAIDIAAVEAAIAAAEKLSSGEIRVTLSPFFWGSVHKAAESAFVRLGMTQTKLHNGVLFFVVPSRKTFMVLGDRGIHEKVGQEFWERVAAALSEHFRRGEFTEGLVAGITQAGEQLAAHFPHDPEGDVNELPNAVDLPPRG